MVFKFNSLLYGLLVFGDKKSYMITLRLSLGNTTSLSGDSRDKCLRKRWALYIIDQDLCIPWFNYLKS